MTEVCTEHEQTGQLMSDVGVEHSWGPRRRERPHLSSIWKGALEPKGTESRPWECQEAKGVLRRQLGSWGSEGMRA